MHHPPFRARHARYGGPPSPLQRANRRSLQRRLFVWFGVTVAVTGVVVALVFATFGPGSSRWRTGVDGAASLVSEQFALVWEDAAARRELASRIARALDVNVTVEDTRGAELERVGERCTGSAYVVVVRREQQALGRVRGCAKGSHHGHLVLLAALLAAGTTLWLACAWIARRLTRPLAELARVTNEIGAGRLSARVRLTRHQTGEVGALADAVNDMAERIEKQMRDQRELLAAVSHEIRSPLSRLRVLAELLQEGTLDQSRLRDLEREVLEIDELVGKLLASSRLDFEAIDMKPLPAAELARRALESAGLGAELLEDASAGVFVDADATLLGRALANIIENAKSHGGGVRKLSVRVEPGSAAEGNRAPYDLQRVLFEVLDAGSGFAKEDLQRVFEPFFRSGERGHGTLGLGLSLVERIARAHGGSAIAHNCPNGGASVGIRLPLAAAGPAR